MPGVEVSDATWYKDAIIYQLHIRSFFDSDNDGIGDFRGLLGKLDYLQDLGVTAIWILPFYPSPLKDDGYDIADYTDVNPDYGTIDDFKALVSEIHERGLKLITELVINHTSDQHPWFQAARRAPPGSPERDFYIWSDNDKKYPETRIIFVDSEPSNWTWDEVAQSYYWHRFFSHQPDLNHNNEKVVEEVVRVMSFWLDLGVDGLRLDAIPYLCVREGTNNENLPETHAVIKKLRAAMDQRFSNRMLLGEANQWPEDAREYFGDGDECHMSFHFPLMPRLFMAVAQEDRYPVTEIIRQTPEIPENCQWATFLRNHDELTLEMVSDRERDYMYKVYATEPRMRCNIGIRRRLAPLMDNDSAKIRLMNGLLLSLVGSPIIYSGDEIGMGDNIFLGDRNGVRTPMQWSLDRNGGFSRADPSHLCLPPIMDPVYGYQALNVEAQQRSPTSLLNWMRQIIGIRQLHPAFSRGRLSFLFPGNRNVLAYVRHKANDEEDDILCVANLSRNAQPVELDLRAYQGHVPIELLGRTPFPPIGKLPYLLTLPGHFFYWFRLAKGHEAPHWHQRREPLPPELPYLVLREEGLDSLMEGNNRRDLEEEILPTYLATRDWFSGQGAEIKKIRIRKAEINPASEEWIVVVVDVNLEGGDLQHYFLPLAIAWESAKDDPLSSLGGLVMCGVRRGNRTGVLFDALADQGFVGTLSLGIMERRERGKWRSALFEHDPGRGQQLPEIKWLGRRKNCYRIGNDLAVDIFRKIEAGTHPVEEIGSRFRRRKFSATYLGSIGIRLQGDDRRWCVGMLRRFVPSRDNAFRYLVDQLARFIDVAASRPGAWVEDIGGLDGFCTLLGEMNRLGERTRQLHRAFCRGGEDSEFRSEKIDAADLRLWREEVVAELGRTLRKLEKAEWDEIMRVAKDYRDRVLETKPLLDEYMSSFKVKSAGLVKCRCHGDLELERILLHEHDFIFYDFKGREEKTFSERREKHSPLRDVASILVSIDLAVRRALHDYYQERGESGGAVKASLERWHSLILDAFLAGYFKSIRNKRREKSILALLDLFVIERMTRILRLELERNSNRIDLALAAFLETVEEKLRVFNEHQHERQK